MCFTEAKSKVLMGTDNFVGPFFFGMTGDVMKHLFGGGDTNTKLRKSGPDVESAGLSLAHHKTSGVGNLCTHSSDGCVETCVGEQGMASVWPTIKDSRIQKSRMFYRNRAGFLKWMRDDILRLIRKSVKDGKKLAVRPNMFSDVYWERYGIIQEFPDVQFYDYTKHPGRIAAKNALLTNYHVTFSRSENNHRDVMRALLSNCNVSVVFADRDRPFVANRSHLQRLPKTWKGFRVVDGDVSDLRYEDPVGRRRGVVIGLRLKAHSYEIRTKAIASGFAVMTGR